MNQTKQRQIAIRAARSQARLMGIDPASITGRAALAVLDDVARVDPALVASVWYLTASDNQARLFCREWQREVNGR